MSNLNITTALLGLGLAVVIIWLVRRDHLNAVHGLFWLAMAALAALLGVWPGLIDRLAFTVGVSYPPALLFLAAVMALVVKALHADILNTRVEREVRRLNQRLALLELEQANGHLSEPSPPLGMVFKTPVRPEWRERGTR